MPPDEYRKGDWREDGLCFGSFNPVFFNKDDWGGRKAKAICQKCPVQGPCQEYALTTAPRYGVWGGLTATQRIKVRGQLIDA